MTTIMVAMTTRPAIAPTTITENKNTKFSVIIRLKRGKRICQNKARLSFNNGQNHPGMTKWPIKKATNVV